jgi:hypothetical protein
MQLKSPNRSLMSLSDTESKPTVRCNLVRQSSCGKNRPGAATDEYLSHTPTTVNIAVSTTRRHSKISSKLPLPTRQMPKIQSGRSLRPRGTSHTLTGIRKSLFHSVTFGWQTLFVPQIGRHPVNHPRTTLERPTIVEPEFRVEPLLCYDPAIGMKEESGGVDHGLEYIRRTY